MNNADDAGAPAGAAHPEGERLQKVMAAAGVASRRASEDLIAQGRVSVNGEIVTEPGRRVVPTDRVTVDDVAIQLDVSKRYVMLNKPPGVVSSMADEAGRPDLRQFTKDYPERLFNVGRLDQATSGLLVLTNDGELAHRLAHPSHGVPKTYLAQVPGPVPRDLGKRLKEGIELDDGPARVDGFRVVDSFGSTATVEVVLHEGRNHIVRRLLAEVGHPVQSLVRTKVGPIPLGDLRPGRLRTLGTTEVGSLYSAVGL